jgi:hypothetical protein
MQTRKSPTVDGVVERDAAGKEIRYVVRLTDEEQEIARRVSAAFKQTVCGFDLLRSNGRYALSLLHMPPGRCLFWKIESPSLLNSAYSCMFLLSPTRPPPHTSLFA